MSDAEDEILVGLSARKKKGAQTKQDAAKSNTAAPATPPTNKSNVKKEEVDGKAPASASNTPVRSRKNRPPPKKRAREDDDASDDNKSDDEKAVKAPPKKKAKTDNKKSKKVVDDDEDEEMQEANKSDDEEDADVEEPQAGDTDDDDDEDASEEDESPKKKKRAPAKKKQGKKEKKPAKKKAPKKEQSDDDDDEEEEAKPAKKTKKEASSSGEKSEKTKKKEEKDKKKKEEDDSVYKWWKEESTAEIKKKKQKDSVKWTTFKHSGVLLAPEYKAHGIKMLYKGKPVKLTAEAEEIATMYAVMRNTEYYNKELFKKNFWKEFSSVLGDDHTIQDLEHCDFTPIYEWALEEKEKKKNRSKEEKTKEKEENAKIIAMYQYAEIDGRKEQVSNFRVEPPGLFRGRGEHPLQGSLKKRIQPEDITINIGKKADAPKPPSGHKWKEVVSRNDVTWLAMWKDNVTENFKYVQLAASSSFKGRSDFIKYENARELKDLVEEIRENYKTDWEDEDLTVRQRAVALYFIDRLALRVGNEKDEDEADTVGCCSLRVEHIELADPTTVKFDFLGKDSIRYQNSVSVEKKVYANLKEFVKGKGKNDNLFNKLNTTMLNSYLKTIMPTLTAKVFRTFNASLTLDKELEKATDDLSSKTVQEKIEFYNNANRQVAILCNHQRAAPKTFGETLSKMDKQITDELEYKAALEKAIKNLKKKDYEDVLKEWEKQNEEAAKQYEIELEDFEKQKKEIEEKAKKAGKSIAVVKAETKEVKPPKKPAKRVLPKTEEAIQKKIEQVDKKIKDLEVNRRMKDDNKTIALGTSRINYCDPRITVSFCKKYDIPIAKLFSKTLQKKFPWAMDAEEYNF